MCIRLDKTKIIALEIGNECNLSNIHKKCPINQRIIDKTYGELSVDRILEVMDEAIELGFQGDFAFHYYNEPLIYKHKILLIIKERPDNKYLLWTNGLLLDKEVENNEFLTMFEHIVITCYDFSNMDYFSKLQDCYKNIQIATWQLDDRLNIYNNAEKKFEGCRRVFFEMPIDYYGNVHLCCEDWNNQFKIGNVNKNSLKEIVYSEVYQNLLSISEKGGSTNLNEEVPSICRKCSVRWIQEEVDLDKIVQ